MLLASVCLTLPWHILQGMFPAAYATENGVLASFAFAKGSATGIMSFELGSGFLGISVGPLRAGDGFLNKLDKLDCFKDCRSRRNLKVTKVVTARLGPAAAALALARPRSNGVLIVGTTLRGLRGQEN